MTPSILDLRTRSFLTTLCYDEHEPYFPADGTYYSSCDYFRRSSLDEIRGFWKKTVRLIRAGKAPAGLGIYLHWPFCSSRCSFCFCSMSEARSARRMEDYASLLKKEMEAFRDLFENIKFDSVYFGGGTPSFAPEKTLDGLLKHVRDSFPLTRSAEIYVEASPATLTEGKMRMLERNGVNRVTVGVQSMDPAVLARVKRRGQTRRVFDRALRLITGAPGVYSGVELMLGLEGQSLRSFLNDLELVMKKGPDAVYVFGFDPRPQTPFARAGKKLSGPLSAGREKLMPLLDRVARLYGYRTPTVEPNSPAYMRTISSQCREARRSGASILGLGAGSLSHAYGSAWYRHPPAEELGGGGSRIPPFFCMESGLEEEMRGYAVRHICVQGRVSRAGFKAFFGKDVMQVPALARTFRRAEAAGELRIGPEAIAFLDPNRARRLMFSKNLYSPRLVAKILSSHREEFRRFNRRFTDAEVAGLAPVADKRTAALMTTFEKPAAV